MTQQTSNPPHYHFAEWQEPHFRPVNKFYKQQKHKGKANGDERVFVIWQDPDDNSQDNGLESSIVGAVRLVPMRATIRTQATASTQTPVPNEAKAEASSSPDYYWLRSLYIDSDLRGQQLGSKLLAYVRQNIITSAPLPTSTPPTSTSRTTATHAAPMYCFPYEHLLHFYQQAGWQLCEQQALPQAIADLYTRYTQRGEKILAMHQPIQGN